jgi:hypothetical protein
VFAILFFPAKVNSAILTMDSGRGVEIVSIEQDWARSRRRRSRKQVPSVTGFVCGRRIRRKKAKRSTPTADSDQGRNLRRCRSAPNTRLRGIPTDLTPWHYVTLGRPRLGSGARYLGRDCGSASSAGPDPTSRVFHVTCSRGIDLVHVQVFFFTVISYGSSE